MFIDIKFAILIKSKKLCEIKKKFLIKQKKIGYLLFVNRTLTQNQHNKERRQRGFI
jgi:hypothetical protein